MDNEIGDKMVFVVPAIVAAASVTHVAIGVVAVATIAIIRSRYIG